MLRAEDGVCTSSKGLPNSSTRRRTICVGPTTDRSDPVVTKAESGSSSAGEPELHSCFCHPSKECFRVQLHVPPLWPTLVSAKRGGGEAHPDQGPPVHSPGSHRGLSDSRVTFSCGAERCVDVTVKMPFVNAQKNSTRTATHTHTATEHAHKHAMTRSHP